MDRRQLDPDRHFDPAYVVPRASVPTVALSASPSTVLEGGTVTVTATRSAAASSAVTLRLRGMLSSITIPAGQTSATATFTAAEDDDHTGITQWTEGQFDETLEVTVNAGTPPGVLTEPEASGFSGHGSMLQVPADQRHRQRRAQAHHRAELLQQSQAQLDQRGRGGPGAVEISRIVRGETVIPLTYAHISTEDGDFSGPASVTLTYPPSDAWTGVITIPEDGDTGEDEQYESFRVSLGALPGWVEPPAPNCTHLIGTPPPTSAVPPAPRATRASRTARASQARGRRTTPTSSPG